MTNATITVGPYNRTETEYLPYNPDAHRVAKIIAEGIVAAKNDLAVEHIGSTAVPGCWGNGVVDLLVVYGPGALAAACAALESIGFQRQTGPDASADSRPMYTGSIEHLGRVFGLHVRVVEKSSSEVRDLLKFRDLLRGNAGLRRAYEAEKRRMLARDVTKGTEYADAKAEFIRCALAAAEL